MGTFHIHIKGQVQGVGFRPYVYKMACRWGLKGYVNNANNGVNVEINGSQRQARNFLSAIIKNAPRRAKIDTFSLKQSFEKPYNHFEIRNSNFEGEKEVRVSPDFGICAKCKKETENAKDRRFQYAFTTCTYCGPRYSIITGLPYDRGQTTMKDFGFCAQCEQEYQDPMDRRFYAQTNSCPTCGIRLTLYDADGRICHREQETIISKAVALLKMGKIVAFKGIGGYLLCCDAYSAKAVTELRRRKHRPDKPFALLYPSLEMIESHAFVSDAEREALSGTESPIVLLKLKKRPSRLAKETIAPRLNQIGVMLAYTPLLHLLSSQFGHPLVATSGNLSGSPVIYNDRIARQELTRFSDYMVTDDRPIATGQDDSVIRFVNDQSVFIRRSRGFAPSYFGAAPSGLGNGLLAMGAHMKGAFALMHQNQVFVSQYLGSLESFESQSNFDQTLKHLTDILNFTPTKVLVDKHPDYYTSKVGKEISAHKSLSYDVIQHHEAHFAAVLQENDLVGFKGPVLGVIWDGMGYGTVGQVWGGEFFRYQNHEMDRLAHLNYVPNLLGDQMARQPRLSALAFSQFRTNGIKSKFSPKEWELYNKYLKAPFLKTSSMGRLFDAVASLLDILDIASFEGQAGMYLEQLVSACAVKSMENYPVVYRQNVIDTRPIIHGIIEDRMRGQTRESIAWKFHFTLVEMVRTVAMDHNIGHLAFSGGVFQNAVLVGMLNEHLAGDFKLYFHKALAPNDENISFGQLARHHIKQRYKTSTSKDANERRKEVICA